MELISVISNPWMSRYHSQASVWERLDHRRGPWQQHQPFPAIPPWHLYQPTLCLCCYRYLLELMKRDIKPLDIMTKKAFENGLTTVMALGGSTNAVLHLLAMSRAADIPLDLEDFQRISNKTPYIADLRPSGKYMMNDLHKVMLCLGSQRQSGKPSICESEGDVCNAGSCVYRVIKRFQDSKLFAVLLPPQVL